jgi:hypothetical protein
MAITTDNTGFVHRNKYHKPGEKTPAAKGEALIDGVEYEVAIWSPKEGKPGSFMRFKRKDGADESTPATQQGAATHQAVAAAPLAPIEPPRQERRSLLR